MTDDKRKRITDDFLRFIRHEAMQQNVRQDEVSEIIKTVNI